MVFRKSVKNDLEAIMEIIRDAQENFKAKGINQWQNGYPNSESILKDIEEENSYVLVQDNRIIATAAVIFGEEVTYRTIFEGKWLSDQPYAVVHRIAVALDQKGRGLSFEIMKQVEILCSEKGVTSLKVDTHEENLPMQGLLKKAGYCYCGIIYLLDGQKRLAYEKLLNEIPK